MKTSDSITRTDSLVEGEAESRSYNFALTSANLVIGSKRK